MFIENPAEVVDMPLEGNLYTYVINNPQTYTDPDGMRTDFNVGVKPMYDHLVPWGGMTREQKIVDGIGTGVAAVTTVAPIAAAVGLIAAPIVIAATPFVGDIILSASVTAHSAQTAVTGVTAAEVGYALGIAKDVGYNAMNFAVTYPAETTAFIVGAASRVLEGENGLPESNPYVFGANKLGGFVVDSLRLNFEKHNSIDSQIKEFE